MSRVKDLVNRVRYPWPRHMQIEELFNNDDGKHSHVHVASRERKKLVRLGHIAQHRYGGSDSQAVREFPPFDHVDDVHTQCTWHLRDSSDPDKCRDYAHRGNGLAFDFRAVRRQEFANAVKRRYHPRRCDF